MKVKYKFTLEVSGETEIDPESYMAEGREELHDELEDEVREEWENVIETYDLDVTVTNVQIVTEE